jgi:hypothetical protein|tara:strand:+ start:2148 stop:2495 length:348 start_codon:yes stop_codon:yes gene_type:complete
MTHNWEINDLKRTVSNGLVIEVNYSLKSSDDGTSARIHGSFNVSGSPSDSDFIAYEDLTEINVLGWLDSSVNKGEIEAQNSSSIAFKKAEITSIPELYGSPWATYPSGSVVPEDH